ncbi:hypothetical protein AcW1_007470 [Taiwanofungus camphoratus]|nr:hypothetical protein AcW1_007470 [Antrodia cinnamomea]
MAGSCDEREQIARCDTFVLQIGVPDFVRFLYLAREVITTPFIENSDLIQPAYRLLAPAINAALRLLVYNENKDGLFMAEQPCLDEPFGHHPSIGIPSCTTDCVAWRWMDTPSRQGWRGVHVREHRGCGSLCGMGPARDLEGPSDSMAEERDLCGHPR